jgi:Rieske Fe-S protein
MRINRRKALQTIAVSGTTLLLKPAKAQNLAAYRIADLSNFESEGAIVQFPFDGRHALALRVSEAQPNRTLKLEQNNQTIYLVAYHLVCTHLGCTPALPNADGVLICPCHNSKFFALDGKAADSRPNPALKAIALERRGTALFAIGYL